MAFINAIIRMNSINFIGYISLLHSINHTMKRKEFLKNAMLVAAGATGVLACASEQKETESGASGAISNKQYNWRMVTTWPPKFPVLGESAELFAEWMKEATGGRVNIKVYGAGELVPALETFDAVSSGTADMGSGASYYWAGKSPAAQFFAAVPFGMNAQQVNSWMLAGEGYDLWREVYSKFNLVPFLGGNTGVQMGGWFNKEINTVNDLKGLKMRIPGLAGKVLERAGGAAVLVAGGEIYTSLERGVIDATEWIGPYHDQKMGFSKIAKYYYTPGWHEPGTQLEMFINKETYEGLPADLKAIMNAVSMRVHAWVLAEFDAQNGTYLEKLMDDGVQLRSFPKPVLEELRAQTNVALQEIADADPVSKKVYTSYKKFQNKIAKWSQLTEQAYYNDIQKVDSSYLQ